jgi:hypothetical protein
MPVDAVDTFRAVDGLLNDANVGLDLWHNRTPTTLRSMVSMWRLGKTIFSRLMRSRAV